jgi:hypothetical protein
MHVIEETVKIYQAKDGTKFKDKGECQTYEKSIPYGNYYAKLSNLKTFEVSENHLKLIKRNQIEWVFFRDGYNSGHFYQDCKRPYGNSDWVGDIAEILGIEPDCSNPNDEDEKWFSESLEYFLVCHHIDMRIVMEILCQNLSIHKGKYERESVYSSDWVVVA